MENRDPRTIRPRVDVAAYLDGTLEPSPATRRQLDGAHRRHRMMPIVRADSDGAFPEGAPAPAPVVPDANWIRSDLLYAAKTGRRTAFVTAANVGVIRLYCAPHVIAEVDEHLEEWCAGKVTASDARERWVTEYLPLMRVIEPALELLSGSEKRRVDDLALRDADDVPSATLAIVLRATFLSRDNTARRAVYGEGHDLNNDESLLEWLFMSGDAAELAQMVEAIGTAAGAAGYGLFHLVRYLWRRSPEGLLLLLAAGALGATLIPRQRLQSLGRGIADGAAYVGRMHVLALEWRQAMNRGMPPPPNWTNLAADLTPANALTRAIGHEMARRSESHISAAEMAWMLPDLPFAQGEKRVRAVLRESASFRQVYAGRWQLGDPWIREDDGGLRSQNAQ